MSKLVLDGQVPASYNKAVFTQIIRAITNQVNPLSEGRASAKYQAQATVPSSVPAAVGDIVWDSNATVSLGSVRLGWICNVESPTNATFQEIRVLIGTPVQAASQAEQETGSSTTTYVAPGRQQLHPSAAKWWLKCDAAGAVSASYNVTSISDDGVGTVTVTIGTDFSSENWSAFLSVLHGSTVLAPQLTAQAAGTATFAVNSVGSSPALTDPTSWTMGGFGDQ